jgi:nuclear transport factor 2 (NTF2) superfamily protein
MTKKNPKSAPRRTRFGRRAAKKFLAAYKEAWETRNPELATSLFTRDAHYWETPFSEPAVGREAILGYWKTATDTQNDIRFSVRNFHLTRYRLVAEWACRYTHRPSGERRELAGVLLADFHGSQVRTFREYWHRRAL